MQSLKTVLAALRQEVDAALAEGRDLPRGTRWEAERVVLSLRVAIQEQSAANGGAEITFGVLEGTAGDAASAHTLTIEFKAASGAGVTNGSAASVTAANVTPATPSETKLEGAAALQVVQSLKAVFDAPGFDSSARATVFREALEGLTDHQVRAVIDSLNGAPLSDSASAVRQARHLLLGVLRSGPLRSVERGGQVLADVFGRHAVTPLIQLIADTWKTQDDWLNAPNPSPASNN